MSTRSIEHQKLALTELAKRSVSGTVGHVLLIVVAGWKIPADDLPLPYPLMVGLFAVLLSLRMYSRWSALNRPDALRTNWTLAWIASNACNVLWGFIIAGVEVSNGAGLGTIVVAFFTCGIATGTLSALAPNVWIQRAALTVLLLPVILTGVIGIGLIEFTVLHTVFLAFTCMVGNFFARAFWDGVHASDRLRAQAEELAHASGEMREILDHMGQGFLTISPRGKIARERSAVVEEWLGALPEDATIWEQLATFDAQAAFAIELGWMQLDQGVVPLQIVLQMLPKRMRCGERHLDLVFRPILQDDRLARMLLVMSDATSSVAREKAEQANREWVAVIGRLMADRVGFREFFDDAEALCTRISDTVRPNRTELFRDVHTLKGNCSVFGLESVAATCHTLETALQEEGTITAEQRRTVRQAWETVAAPLRELLDHASQNIELSPDDHRAFLQALTEGAPRDRLVSTAATWVNEPVARQLARIGAGAKALSVRLGKPEVTVHVDAHGLRLPHGSLREFWSGLVHAARNAVDHGIEPPEVREESGKSAAGRIVLDASLVDDDLVVTVTDDGPGIHWGRVAAKARERGLPARTDRDLQAALFSDGLSTRDAADEISGRGVGLAALHALCLERGGGIEVTSKVGAGTTVRCRIPLHASAPRASETRARRVDTREPSVTSL